MYFQMALNKEFEAVKNQINLMEPYHFTLRYLLIIPGSAHHKTFNSMSHSPKPSLIGLSFTPTLPSLVKPLYATETHLNDKTTFVTPSYWPETFLEMRKVCSS